MEGLQLTIGRSERPVQRFASKLQFKPRSFRMGNSLKLNVDLNDNTSGEKNASKWWIQGGAIWCGKRTSSPIPTASSSPQM